MPMPTFVLAAAPFTPAMLPSTIELLAVTSAPAPMAVALLKLPVLGTLLPSPKMCCPYP